MLGIRKKSKKKKGSISFSGAFSGSNSDVDDRVIMLCEDIPSEASSWDSGRGSHSSGARSSGDELGHGWRSRSFHGREAQSSSARPMKQYSVREIRHVEAFPGYGQNAGHSLCIREAYESAPPIAFYTYCICLLY